MSQDTKTFFEEQLKTYFAHRKAVTTDVETLLESVEYSLFNGGKRFRPMLCYAVAEALDLSRESVTPFAMALECIHTYSLIHDDLPCMDDDDERRGQPTNHIKFGEEVALLAGDSLLTEAFQILATDKNSLSLVELLAEGAGLAGMIRGQVLDLGKGKPIRELGDLIHLHELKTGRLISLCFQAPARLAGKSEAEMAELGLQLGLAFQIKDDLLDAGEDDEASFISFLGEEGTKSHLESLTEKINTNLKTLGLDTAALTEMIQFNLNRQK